MRYISASNKRKPKAVRRFIHAIATPKQFTPSSAACGVCGGATTPVKCDMLCLRCLGVSN